MSFKKVDCVLGQLIKNNKNCDFFFGRSCSSTATKFISAVVWSSPGVVNIFCENLFNALKPHRKGSLSGYKIQNRIENRHCSQINKNYALDFCRDITCTCDKGDNFNIFHENQQRLPILKT